MTNVNLDTCAMLVEFNASVWTARKLDRTVSDEVEASKGAKSKGAARVNKNLLAGRSELEDITSHVNAVRVWVHGNSMPWSDNGQRLLPTTRFVAFDARMAEHKTVFEQKVNDFVQLYPTLITAQAMALGEMFHRDEYPSASSMSDKFAFTYDYLPVPSSGDFRVDVGTEAQRLLQERMEKLATARVQKIETDFQERLVEHLQRMSKQLVTEKDAKTGELKGKRIYDTLVTGAYDLCDLIKDMPSVRGGAADTARIALEQALGGVGAQTLRDDPSKREAVRVQVTNLLDKFAI